FLWRNRAVGLLLGRVERITHGVGLLFWSGQSLRAATSLCDQRTSTRAHSLHKTWEVRFLELGHAQPAPSSWHGRLSRVALRVVPRPCASSCSSSSAE